MVAVSRSDTPRSSGWARWKAMILLLRFKKNPDEKYFFIVEKFDFEKKNRIFLEIFITFPTLALINTNVGVN